MNKFYKIMGSCQGQVEEIDVATSKSEADYLIVEYKMAYGNEWRIWSQPAKRM